MHGGWFDGRVVRPMRCVNPDQDEYHGIVEISSLDGEPNGEESNEVFVTHQPKDAYLAIFL